MKAFKIYNEHHVDNHILFLRFFLPCEQFLFFCDLKPKKFCSESHISRNWNWAVRCYTEKMKEFSKHVDVTNCGTNLKKLHFDTYVTLLHQFKKNYWHCMWHQDWLVIQNLHFCGLYKSHYQFKLKSTNLLTIPLCLNLLD